MSLTTPNMHGQHMLSKISMWHPLYLNRGGFAVPAPGRAAGCWAGSLKHLMAGASLKWPRTVPRTQWEGPHPCPVTPAVQSGPELFVSAPPSTSDKFSVEKPREGGFYT